MRQTQAVRSSWFALAAGCLALAAGCGDVDPTVGPSADAAGINYDLTGADLAGGDLTVVAGQGSGGAGGGALSDCPSCKVFVPSSYAQGTPTKLLVALHGDEGRDFGLDAATSGVIGSWQAAAEGAGYIVLAVACPAGKGCNGAWSDWLAQDGYHPSAASLAWMDAQVTDLEGRYNIDRSREYLSGYSGGAYWLGYYAQARASRFGGVAFVAGGMPAYTSFNACPACKLPGYFLGGDKDPRTGGQMSDTANAFNGCGEPIKLDVVMNADHDQTIGSLATGRAKVILAWFNGLPLSCN